MYSYDVLLFPFIISLDFVVLDVTDRCIILKSHSLLTDFVSQRGYSAPSLHFLEVHFSTDFSYLERK